MVAIGLIASCGLPKNQWFIDDWDGDLNLGCPWFKTCFYYFLIFFNIIILNISIYFR